MTVLRIRALIFRTQTIGSSNLVVPGKGQPKDWSARNWALVALSGILVIAGLEGYALSRGIHGVALRTALVSIGVLSGAGIGRCFPRRITRGINGRIK